MSVGKDVSLMDKNKGIFAIYNKGKCITIRTSDDLEKSREDFDRGNLIEGRLGDYLNRCKTASFEIIKVTDTPEKDIWLYLLPKISRVKYEEDLIDSLANGAVKDNHVKNAVNWFCEYFPGKEYKAIFDHTTDNYIMLSVIKEEKTIEIYGFKGGKQPTDRIILDN